jgi:hypothetical protein
VLSEKGVDIVEQMSIIGHEMKTYQVTVFADKTEWKFDGKLHREDGPAVEWVDGYKEWYINGEYHREGGPAVEYVSGDKYWYINGKHHREDGPAVEYANGDKFWFINGKYHREDGPAVERADGRKYWYINGEEMTAEEFNSRKVKEFSMEELEKVLGYKVKIVKK